ncbi:MAG: hypothetical protein U0793_28755 [Gemmataceae bacterium]
MRWWSVSPLAVGDLGGAVGGGEEERPSGLKKAVQTGAVVNREIARLEDDVEVPEALSIEVGSTGSEVGAGRVESQGADLAVVSRQKTPFSSPVSVSKMRMMPSVAPVKRLLESAEGGAEV